MSAADLVDEEEGLKSAIDDFCPTFRFRSVCAKESHNFEEGLAISAQEMLLTKAQGVLTFLAIRPTFVPQIIVPHRLVLAQNRNH